MSSVNDILHVNIRSYPSEFAGYVTVRVVLVAGEIGDYAAYIGQGSSEWVRQFGDKLSFEEARCHFPIGLEREKYRE